MPRSESAVSIFSYYFLPLSCLFLSCSATYFRTTKFEISRKGSQRIRQGAFTTRLLTPRSVVLLALDAQSLLILSRTCKTLREEILRIWDINTRLLRFFDEPTAFRSKLGECDALIAGSFALQFFEGVFWRESDLDIEVQVGETLEKLHNFMIGRGGYRLATKDDESRAFAEAHNVGEQQEYLAWHETSDVVEVRTYYRKKGVTVLKAQLIATGGLPVQCILRCYYTSCIMNFITWNKAYSIFPNITFVRHKTVPLRALDHLEQPYYIKYRERGFDLEPRVSTREKGEFVIRPGASYAQRRIGDRYTWTIKLDTKDVEPATPDHLFESNSFSISEPISGHWVGPGCYSWCLIVADNINATALQQDLTRGDWGTWEPFLAKVRDWGLSQLQQSNPLRYEDIMRDWEFDEFPFYHKPRGWKYLDPEIALRLVKSFVDHLQSDGDSGGIRSLANALSTISLGQ